MSETPRRISPSRGRRARSRCPSTAASASFSSSIPAMTRRPAPSSSARIATPSDEMAELERHLRRHLDPGHDLEGVVQGQVRPDDAAPRRPRRGGLEGVRRLREALRHGEAHRLHRRRGRARSPTSTATSCRCPSTTSARSRKRSRRCRRRPEAPSPAAPRRSPSGAWPASSAMSPDSTLGRWLSRGSPRMSKTDPAAPALGSMVAMTTRGTRARTIAPAHIAQGSSVT